MINEKDDNETYEEIDPYYEESQPPPLPDEDQADVDWYEEPPQAVLTGR